MPYSQTDVDYATFDKNNSMKNNSMADPTTPSKQINQTPMKSPNTNSRRYVDEPEVDYDVNPTELYKHIEKREWELALNRISETPIEVMSWVSRHEIEQPSKLRWRLLPLHATCVFRAPVAVVESLLMTYPESAQMKDDQGMLPIHLACRNGASKGVVMMLLDYFPESVDMKDKKDRTPLGFCTEKSHQNCEVVKQALISFGEEFRKRKTVEEEMQNEQKHKEQQQALVNAAVVPNEVDYEHRTILFRHIVKKDWDTATNRCKLFPVETSTWIVTKGFKGNLRFLPVHKACVLQPPATLVTSLLSSYPDGAKCADQDGWLPIHCAAFYGASQDVIDALIQVHPKGAHCKDEEGRLPLHYACLKGASLNTVTSLLQCYPKGATSKDDEGRLPIHHACSKGAPPDVISALLSSSPKSAASKDDQGRLPLHHACRKNPNNDIIELLLKAYPKGAQIKDDQEKLPIHYACHSNNETVISALLQVYPQSILVKNGFGYTPLAEARALDNPKMDSIIQLLESHHSQFVVSSSGDPKSPTLNENDALKNQVAELNKTVASLGNVLQGVAQLGTDIQSSLNKGKDSKEVLKSLSERLSNIDSIASPGTTASVKSNGNKGTISEEVVMTSEPTSSVKETTAEVSKVVEKE